MSIKYEFYLSIRIEGLGLFLFVVLSCSKVHFVGARFEIFPSKKVRSSSIRICDPEIHINWHGDQTISLISPGHQFCPGLLPAHPVHGDHHTRRGAAKACVQDVGGHWVRVTPGLGHGLGPGAWHGGANLSKLPRVTAGVNLKLKSFTMEAKRSLKGFCQTRAHLSTFLNTCKVN